jgi:hypothetical protein
MLSKLLAFARGPLAHARGYRDARRFGLRYLPSGNKWDLLALGAASLPRPADAGCRAAPSMTKQVE